MLVNLSFFKVYSGTVKSGMELENEINRCYRKDHTAVFGGRK